MPRHGALGAAFLMARIVQTCSMIAIIGLTANFIAEIVKYDAQPPGVFIGTITIVRPLHSFSLSSILFRETDGENLED